MRLVWLSHTVPYPPQGGPLQRSFNLIREMSRSYEISLVAFNLQGAAKENLDDYICELKKYCAEVEIWEMPYQWKGIRWWAGLSLSPFGREPFGCRAFWSRPLALRWEQILYAHRDALVHFDSPDLAMYTPAAKDFRKVLNHHNCESAMTFRRAQKETNTLKKFYLSGEARKLARLENEVCPQFDVNIVVSECDSRLLRARHANIHIHIVENGVDTTYFVPARGGEEARSLIFTGLLQWYPNVSGLTYFGEEIWPLVKRQCPDVKLYIAGKNPTGSLRRWSERDPNVVVVANPEDMRPWIARAAVYICPLLEGGGTRLKILDAMALATPVVSTAIGCEGLRVRHGENILIADRPAAFASSIINLFSDDELRRRLGGAGRALVETYYDWEKIGLQLEQAYRCARNDTDCGQRGPVECQGPSE